ATLAPCHQHRWRRQECAVDRDQAPNPRCSRHGRGADRSELRCRIASDARQPAMRAGPIDITGLGAIAERFDHVLLDQWGTLHEGSAISAAAYDCVTKLRDAGKRVLALSNSGKRADANERRLAALGLPRETYDGVLSSGEVAWHGLRARDREPF